MLIKAGATGHGASRQVHLEQSGKKLRAAG